MHGNVWFKYYKSTLVMGCLHNVPGFSRYPVLWLNGKVYRHRFVVRWLSKSGFLSNGLN